MNNQIRLATPDDAAAISQVIIQSLRQSNALDYPPEVISQVEKSFSTQAIRALLKQRQVFVATIDKRVVATASLDQDVVRSVFVEPGHQGHGLGRQLMATLQSVAQDAKIEVLRVPSSITAEAFYFKLGYRKVRDEFHGAERTIIMERRLTPVARHLEPTMLIANPNASRTPYPDDLKAILNIQTAAESRTWLAHWNILNRAVTPLFSLPGLAANLGIAQLLVKDESSRSELGSFKALGAPIALVRLILRLFPEQHFEPRGLLMGDYRDALKDFTVISATDGNHGRALAAAAHSVGCRCVIVLHANVSLEREQAIAAYGAQIVRVPGNYDESVEKAAALAVDQHWLVVSDTSYEGYEDIPRDVMQGYGTLAAEIVEQVDAQGFTHVFLQGGVGGLAAGLASYFWELYGAARPAMIVVEPQQADCLFQSALAGQPAKTQGSVDSVMAGLACGETSPLAWKFLQTSIDHFMTIEDEDAVNAMRVLALGSDRDVPLIAGESAVAGLAGLIQLLKSPHLAAEVGIDGCSRILLISTEGATAPAVYSELVGETAESVLERQQLWLQ